MFHRKSKWERAIEPVTDHVDAKSLTKSAVTAVVGALALTTASAAISSVRRKEHP
jgi:hypothetical protein